MTRFLFLPIMAFCALSLFSCDRHTHNDDDTEAPVLVLAEPIEGQQVAAGDHLHIEGVVTDESLHEMLIQVRNLADSTIMFTSTPEVHDLVSYNIAEMFTPTGLTSIVNAELYILVEDHSENKTEKRVNVQFLQ